LVTAVDKANAVLSLIKAQT